jgi:hypothetical protein
LGDLRIPKSILQAANGIVDGLQSSAPPAPSALSSAISLAETFDGNSNPEQLRVLVESARSAAVTLVQDFNAWWKGRIDDLESQMKDSSCFTSSSDGQELQSLIASAREAVGRATNPFENFPEKASAAERAVADLSKRLSEKLEKFRLDLVARINKLKTTTLELTEKCSALIAKVEASEVCNPDFESQLGDLDREVTSINAENEQKQQEVCL